MLLMDSLLHCNFIFNVEHSLMNFKVSYGYLLHIFPFAVIVKYLRITVELSLNRDWIFTIHEYDLSMLIYIYF